MHIDPGRPRSGTPPFPWEITPSSCHKHNMTPGLVPIACIKTSDEVSKQEPMQLALRRQGELTCRCWSGWYSTKVLYKGQKGSMYFPRLLRGINRAAQNMSTTQMLTGGCKVPDEKNYIGCVIVQFFSIFVINSKKLFSIIFRVLLQILESRRQTSPRPRHSPQWHPARPRANVHCAHGPRFVVPLLLAQPVVQSNDP